MLIQALLGILMVFQIMNTIDPAVDLCDAYRRGTDADQKFIANLAQFLGAYLKENSQICEVLDNKPENADLKKAHEMVGYKSCFISNGLKNI